MSIADQLIERGRKEGELAGERRGELIGERRGELKGELVGTIRTLQKILGLPVSGKTEFEGKSIDDLQQIADRLHRRLSER